MSIYYVRPAEDETDLLFHAMTTYHPRLHNIGVTVALLMVHDDQNEDADILVPALKHHGVPALGITKIHNLKLRAHGLADAEILIDGDRWKQMTEAERLALLDHELTHLEPVYKHEAPQFDDLRRPKLKMRPHDYDFGWFAEVAERHGKASQEVRQAEMFANENGQFTFGFAQA